jgi:hypothetical protein
MTEEKVDLAGTNNYSAKKQTTTIAGARELASGHDYDDGKAKYTYVSTKGVTVPYVTQDNKRGYYKISNVYVKNEQDQYFFFTLTTDCIDEKETVYMTSDKGSDTGVLDLYGGMYGSLDYRWCNLIPCPKENVDIYPRDIEQKD